MIIGITFFIFLFLGLFVFWGGVKLFGLRYSMLYRKLEMVKDEISANDELLKQKIMLDKQVASLSNEYKLLTARVNQKKAHIDQLSLDIASLEDQGTVAEIKIEIDELTAKKETSSAALDKTKKELEGLESAFRNLNDTYTKEKMLREEKLKAEMLDKRKKLNDEVDEDLARYKEARITETKTTVDTAKVSAVRTIKDWWSTEKKRLDDVFVKDFADMRDEYRLKLKDQVAAEVNDMKQEYMKDK